MLRLLVVVALVAIPSIGFAQDPGETLKQAGEFFGFFTALITVVKMVFNLPAIVAGQLSAFLASVVPAFLNPTMPAWFTWGVGAVVSALWWSKWKMVRDAFGLIPMVGSIISLYLLWSLFSAAHGVATGGLGNAICLLIISAAFNVPGMLRSGADRAVGFGRWFGGGAMKGIVGTAGLTSGAAKRLAASSPHMPVVLEHFEQELDARLTALNRQRGVTDSQKLQHLQVLLQAAIRSMSAAEKRLMQQRYDQFLAKSGLVEAGEISATARLVDRQIKSF